MSTMMAAHLALRQGTQASRLPCVAGADDEHAVVHALSMLLLCQTLLPLTLTGSMAARLDVKLLPVWYFSFEPQQNVSAPAAGAVRPQVW